MDNGCHNGWCFASLENKNACQCRQGINKNERRVDWLGAHSRAVYPSAEDLAERRERGRAHALEVSAWAYAHAREVNGIK